MRKQLDLAMPHHGYAQAVPTSNLAQSNAAFAHRITYKVACHAIPGLERLRLRHLLLLGSAISILQFVQSDIFVPRIVIGAAVWSIVEQSEFSNAARTKKSLFTGMQIHSPPVLEQQDPLVIVCLSTY